MISIHTRVNTPGGVGLVAGRLAQKDQPDKILVSHDPELLQDVPEENRVTLPRGGPFFLAAFLVKEVQEAK